jgi:hypothetical protein
VSRATQVPPRPLGNVSPTRLSRSSDGLSRPFGYTSPQSLLAVLQPRAARCHAPGLGFSAFARRYSRNHCCFLLLRVLRCFSSPRSPRLAAVSGSLPTGSPIRTSAAQWVFAPYRGFSQLVTSFFASESHRHPPCALFAFLFSFSPFLSHRRSLDSICSITLASDCPSLDPPSFVGGLLRGLSSRSQHVNDLFSFIRSPGQTWTADLYIISVAL